MAEERSPCCPPDMHPSASAEAAGAVGDLMGQYVVLQPGNMKCYVSGPKDDKDIKGVVLVYHDIFGFNSSRTHHMCDEMAQKGSYLVVAPDWYDDRGMADPKELLSFSFFSKVGTLASRARLPWDVIEEKLNKAVLPYIRGRTNAKIGVIGFCWGGWAVVRTAGLPSKDIACGVGAHPSVHNQTMQKKGPTMDEMFKAVNVPLLLCPTWNDPSSLREDGHYMKLLREHGGKGSKSILFDRQMHGFTNRSDIRVQKNKEDVDKFMQATLDFFAEHLASTNATEDVQASL